MHNKPTKNKLKKIVNESGRGYLLCENQAAKSMSQAKSLVMQELNYTDEKAEEFVRKKIRDEIPVLHDPKACKFILGVTRLVLDRQIRTYDDLCMINKIVRFASFDDFIGQFTKDLDGMSLSQLKETFAPVFAEYVKISKGQLEKVVFSRNRDYEIVRIDSLEQAKKYARYCQWCVCHFEHRWNEYTANGRNQFYFCLRNDYKNVEKVQGETFPYDNYGMSMIAVSVSSDGTINSSTTRWNHGNNANDDMFSEIGLSKLLGLNFYTVFLPNNKFDRNINESVDKNTLRRLDSIQYEITYNEGLDEDDEGYYSYDITGYDYFSDELFREYDLDFDELINLLGYELATQISSSEKDSGYLDVTNNRSVSDLNNVDEVNALAKDIFGENPYYPGERGYLLTDGTFLYLGPNVDHMAITAIDGMTVGKFVSLGNIRMQDSGFEVEKVPTEQQAYELSRLIYKLPEVYVDVVKYSGEGNYPSLKSSRVFYGSVPSVVLDKVKMCVEDGIDLNDEVFDEYGDY